MQSGSPEFGNILDLRFEGLQADHVPRPVT
jgi:hypothetical protein